jgi:hypothetical protein
VRRTPAPTPPPALPDPTDPRQPELARRRQELARARALLAQELRRQEEAGQAGAALGRELADLAARRRGLEAERSAFQDRARERGAKARVAALSLEELSKRSKALLGQIEALRRTPVPHQALRYRTPVSAPLQSQEVMFECRRGRVTLLDRAALDEEMKRNQPDEERLLRGQWQVSGVTAPVGAFRLRYIRERRRGPLDGPGSAGPAPASSFTYSITWVAEPTLLERGEGADDALKPGSAFRRVVDALDPQETAVTMWVYADSFPLYRRLRDYLHDRDMVVAGRPLADGMRIGSSPDGTASRGQ